MSLRKLASLRVMNDMVALEKRGGVEDVFTGAGRLLYRTPGMIARATSGIGTEVTHALAANPQAPGAFAKGVGGLVRYAPHILGAGLALKYVGKPIKDYAQSKLDQFRARQMESAPYYNPDVQVYQ